MMKVDAMPMMGFEKILRLEAEGIKHDAGGRAGRAVNQNTRNRVATNHFHRRRVLGRSRVPARNRIAGA